MKNTNPPQRTGASIAQGSFKVIGPPTSGARAYLGIRRWFAYIRQWLRTQSGGGKMFRKLVICRRVIVLPNI
jgi:hypothetical protein